jgi:hypothetical protein
MVAIPVGILATRDGAVRFSPNPIAMLALSVPPTGRNSRAGRLPRRWPKLRILLLGASTDRRIRGVWHRA